MIYVLEFDRYLEARDLYTDAHSSLLSIYDTFRRRGIPCFMLYRYRLPNLEFEWLNPRDIKSKFGISCPTKLSLDKIQSKKLIIYHVEAFEKDISKLVEFLQWCISMDIDVFMSKKIDTTYTFKPKFWQSVNEILEMFDCYKCKIESLEDEFRFQRLIERGCKLDDLLD